MSQNYRRVDIGKDVWISLGPSFQLRLGHLELLAQDCVQMTFKYFQGWKLHSFSGQCMPVLSHLHSKEKSVPWCSGRISCISVLCLLPQNYAQPSQPFSFWSFGKHHDTTLTDAYHSFVFFGRYFPNFLCSSISSVNTECWCLSSVFCGSQQSNSE